MKNQKPVPTPHEENKRKHPATMKRRYRNEECRLDLMVEQGLTSTQVRQLLEANIHPYELTDQQLKEWRGCHLNIHVPEELFERLAATATNVCPIERKLPSGQWLRARAIELLEKGLAVERAEMRIYPPKDELAA